jgi:hypothetical protein
LTSATVRRSGWPYGSQFQQDTSSEHTPFSRMLYSVIGSIESLNLAIRNSGLVEWRSPT